MFLVQKVPSSGEERHIAPKSMNHLLLVLMSPSPNPSFENDQSCDRQKKNVHGETKKRSVSMVSFFFKEEGDKKKNTDLLIT